jgi:hypothetical protein
MSLLFVLAGVALADPPVPTVSVATDGAVVATFTVSAPESAVLAVLADPRTLTGPEVLSMATAPQGGCLVIDATTQGMLSPLAYRSLRCPTETGFHETLVQSDDFTAIESTWRLSQVADGTRVDFRLVSQPDLPVPQSVIRPTVVKSVTRMMERLIAAVTP